MNDIHLHPDARPEQLAPAPGATRRKLPKIVPIVAALLVLALLAWWLTPKGNQAAGGGRFGNNGPSSILVAAARTGDMPITLIGLGAVTPLSTVTIQSQISGVIQKIFFKEGQNVKPGDPLFLIDPRPYQVALEQAEGALARDQALLANAHVDLQRYTTLLAQDSISEQTLATQKALVLQDEGTVKTDQAAIDAAKLNLVYCHITSPIPGRAGLQQVNVGNFITSGEPNGLVVITQLQPITVAFTLAEDEVPALLAQMRAGNALAATAYDRSHVTKLASGTLQSIDSQIDPTTGTLKMKAIFSNSEGTLFPQQFVNVDLLLDTLHAAVLVPQAAVQRGAPGTYVYVLNADSTVNVRKVTLGPGDANDIAVTQGLATGEKVVIDGADRLKDGAKVTVREPSAKAGAGAAGPQAPPGAGKGHGQHRHQQQGQGATGDHGSQTGSQ